MGREYNYEAFTPEEVEKGLHLDLINYLLDYNKKSEESYYDIHITSDGYCTIIEWTDASYEEGEWNGAFKYVGEDQEVMTELQYPDNSIEYVFPNEKDEMLRAWLRDHPTWKKNCFGVYVEMPDSSEGE